MIELRQKQQKRRKKALLFAIIILVYGGSASVFFWANPQIRFFEWSAPLHSGVRLFTARFFGIVSDIFSYEDAARERNALRKENERLYARLARAKAIEEENKLLQEALSLRDRFSFRVVPAYVIAFQSDGFTESLFVKKRGDAPVAKNAPVVSETGILIGMVSSIQESSLRVTVLSDPRMVFSGEVVETGTLGSLRGKRFGRMQFTLLDKLQNVEEGHIVMTSAIGEVFPPGLAIGRVTRVTRSDLSGIVSAEVQILTDIRFLREVFILMPPSGSESP